MKAKELVVVLEGMTYYGGKDSREKKTKEKKDVKFTSFLFYLKLTNKQSINNSQDSSRTVIVVLNFPFANRATERCF